MNEYLGEALKKAVRGEKQNRGSIAVMHEAEILVCNLESNPNYLLDREITLPQVIAGLESYVANEKETTLITVIVNIENCLLSLKTIRLVSTMFAGLDEGGRALLGQKAMLLLLKSNLRNEGAKLLGSDS